MVLANMSRNFEESELITAVEIFSRVLCDSTPRYVRRLVWWSVGHTLLFYDFYFLTSLLLPKWSSDLKYGPCPPARDFGSRVSGLVLFAPDDQKLVRVKTLKEI